MKKLILVLIAALCLSAFFATPAQASTRTREHVVTFTGAGWGARIAAREYSRRVKHLTVRFGQCTGHEDACYSITVFNRPVDTIDGPDDEGLWYARTSRALHTIEFNDFWRVERTIGLDTYDPVNVRNASCHEVGHALGLQHHDGWHGCMANWTQNPTHPSDREIQALNKMWNY